MNLGRKTPSRCPVHHFSREILNTGLILSYNTLQVHWPYPMENKLNLIAFPWNGSSLQKYYFVETTSNISLSLSRGDKRSFAMHA